MARQNKDKLHERLEDLFIMYLDSDECRFMRFSQLEDLRKFYVYQIYEIFTIRGFKEVLCIHKGKFIKIEFYLN